MENDPDGPVWSKSGIRRLPRAARALSTAAVRYLVRTLLENAKEPMTQKLDRGSCTARTDSIQRMSIVIRGTVQGVGFRPFIYRLARDLDLTGWVHNSPLGVLVEVEGSKERLKAFLVRIEKEKPPRASIQSLEPTCLDPVGYNRFEIRQSTGSGRKKALILPDIATCADCLTDLFDPKNRRYQYPFTNCTHCGPRYSIIEALPYDRPHTTMKGFAMCRQCRAEYEDPLNRRFHAQPNACPECGPQLELWDAKGRSKAIQGAALRQGVAAVRQGRILAVKGLGGFHLIVDARNEAAVARLRHFKNREEKPFALMYPNLRRIAAHCELSELEERLLCSPEAPIVLLRRNGRDDLASNVAPHNPYFGIMLPYTPLHHLLVHELGRPIVATSGNLAEEPICIDEPQALQRLGKIAELLLVHDRPIRRHVDDSIVRVAEGRELVLRRARGYAPLPVELETAIPSVIGVGAHLKSAVALSIERDAFVSQHIGDLQTAEANAAFCQVIDDFQALYEINPHFIACDAHPDYQSTRYAGHSKRSVLPVQHHCAHVLSCMAENRLTGPLLGVAWDGTGFGLDGTIWGGEFLRISKDSCERAAHLRTFPLPGGDAAVREPRRSALGLLFELFGEKVFEQPDLIRLCGFARVEAALLCTALVRKVNSPRTSSIGRLFDAVSAIVGLRHHCRFEGQAAMELEFAVRKGVDDHYEFECADGPTRVADWEPVLLQVLADVREGASAGEIAAKFHNGLARLIVQMARILGEDQVVLSGGCFQNVHLLQIAVQGLRDEGFRPYWHQRVPPNDGGIALGQIVAAARSLTSKSEDYYVPCHSG